MKFGTKMILGNAIVLGLMVVIGGIVYNSINSLIDTASWVNHTQKVMANGNRLMALMVDKETGERGFLIAGQEEYLEPYNNGLTEFAELMAATKQLVSDNPAQVARLEKIEEMSNEWNQKAAIPEIELRREMNKNTVTITDIIALLDKGTGKRIMDTIRGVFETFINIELKLLEERKAKTTTLDAEAVGWVEHTYQVLLQAENLLAHIVDMETGERGFLITGQEEYLEPYHKGKKGFEELIVEMKQKVSDNPPQVARLEKIEGLVSDWLQQAAIPEIELRREMNQNTTTIDDITALIEKGIGKASMDALRVKLNEFVGIERGLMVEREQAAETTASRTIYIIIFGTLLALVLGGTIAILITRSIMKQIGGEPDKIEAIAQQVALGNTNLQMDSKTSTTGIYNALQKMVEALNLKIELAQEIAKGNLDVQVQLASKDDTLGIALQEMLHSLKEKVKLAQEIAAGNLSLEANLVSSQDTLGEAQKSMINSLNEVLHQVAASANQLTSGAEQLSGSSQTIANGATNQASALEEIASSMEQMGAQTRSNADNATQANQLAVSARQQAEDGNAQMQRMVESMKEINESSENISKIIKTIEVIAFQTNVLAINAAVEAARAGVHGKGFAVVAEEVRNLAQNSAEAAQETAANINESIKKVEAGAKIADETALALKEIVEGSVKVTDLVSEIATASNEQAQGIKGINDGLSQLNQITQQNAQIAEEASSASEELQGQSQNLRQLVSRFKLRQQVFGMHQATLPYQPTAELPHGEMEAALEENTKAASTPQELISFNKEDMGNF